MLPIKNEVIKEVKKNILLTLLLQYFKFYFLSETPKHS
jgi:hypothetical protein